MSQEFWVKDYKPISYYDSVVTVVGVLSKPLGMEEARCVQKEVLFGSDC